MCLSCTTDTGLLLCPQLILEIYIFFSTSVIVSQLDGSHLLVLMLGNYLFKLCVGISDYSVKSGSSSPIPRLENTSLRKK